ncbi:MAG: hypothetical protein NTZ17_04955 [Phycisphaerae bacterium]|nr:hypothetical protein [Phycisphaerae bacterium]
MSAVFEIRSIGVLLRVAGIALWLALAGRGVASAAPPAPGSVLNQLQATQAAVTQMQQNPPSVPPDWQNAKEINEASRRFTAWQYEMFQQQDEIAKKQAKLLHQRMKVPPPLPPSEPDPEPPMTRLDIPLPVWPADINLRLSMGKPTVFVGAGAGAEVLSYVGASGKIGAAYVAKDNRWVFEHPVEVKGQYGSEEVKVAGIYQFFGASWRDSNKDSEGEGGKKPVGGEIAVEVLNFNGAFGYDADHEFSMAAGYDFVKTPKPWSKLFKASDGVQFQLSAPVVVHGLT